MKDELVSSNSEGQRTETYPPRPRVYIVDDDKSSRELLLGYLKLTNLETVAFASAVEFLDHFQDWDDTPRCIILDVCMPNIDGPQLDRRLRSHGINVPVIYVSGRGTIPDAVDAMKRGALDFLPKPVDRERLITCVQRAIESDLAAHRRQRDQATLETKVAKLTKRERDVLQYLVRGADTKEIAKQLGISAKTVFVHRARVIEKMEVDNLVELSRLFNTE